MPAAPAPTIEQALSKAVLKTDRAGTTPEARAAVRIEELVAKDQPLAAIELGRQTPVERSKLDKQREEIGVRRDTAGAKQRAGYEIVRYDAIGDANELHLTYLEKGFDGLNNLQRGALVNVVEQAILASPALASEFRGELARGRTREAIIKDWLQNNPKVSVEMRTVLQRLSNEKGLPDAVTPAKENLDMAQIDLDTAKDDFASVSRRYTTVENHLKSYERDASGIGTAVNSMRIDLLRRALPNLQQTVDQGSLQIKILTQQLNELQDEYDQVAKSKVVSISGKDEAAIKTEYQNARAQLTTAQNAVVNAQNNINELERLQKDEQSLETKRVELEGEKRQKEADVKKKDLDFKKRQREYQDALALRESSENDLVYKFQNVAAEAVSKVIDERINLLHAKLKEDLDKLKLEAKTADDQAMVDALDHYWLGAPKTRSRGIIHRRKETYTPLAGEKIEGSYAVLMDPTQGPKEVMSKLLQSQKNPATGVNYTGDEADIVLKDPEYAKKMQPEVVKHLLARKLMIGGISKADAKNIALSTWGKDMITTAIATKKDVAKQLTDLMGEGALSEVGFFEKLVNNISEHPWLLLLILLGGGIAGVAGVAAAGAGLLGGSALMETVGGIGLAKGVAAGAGIVGVGGEGIGAAVRHEE